MLKSFITYGEKVDSVIKRKTKGIFGIYAERGASTYRIRECLGGSYVELLKYIKNNEAYVVGLQMSYLKGKKL